MHYRQMVMEKADKLRYGNRPVRILAVETSCDESSAAVMEDGRILKSLKIASQVDIHALYGGVVPEIASRQHVEAVNVVIDQALLEAGAALDTIDAVAVTCGPGLVGALLTGVSTAKALAYARALPLIGVNHIEAHICANFIAHPDLKPPFVSLVVSGGHTHLLEVVDYGRYRLIGRTLDDAAGEAFDKVARVIGLPYPGGPKLDEIAGQGDPRAYAFPKARTPGEFDFSFSGLKTAAITLARKLTAAGEMKLPDFAASFNRAVADALRDKALKAARDHGGVLALAGGVACNRMLRAALEEGGAAMGVRLVMPPPLLCTDNAAMVGCAGYYQLMRGEVADLGLNAQPGMALVVDG